jgi:hypothetical protein
MKDKSRAEELAEKRKFWKGQVQNWQESSISQVEYCRKHNLIPHQFTYWKNRIIKPAETPVSLVQVNMKANFNANPMRTSPLRLVFSDPYHVEIDRGFDPVTLRQLLYTLKQL